MNEKDFCYWLQGYSEICGKCPSETQWKIINDRLYRVSVELTHGFIPSGLAQSLPTVRPFYSHDYSHIWTT